MTIHKFGSTSQAYDACQCDPDVKRGDVLLIEAADYCVVGVADTWPFAVTKERGQLHGMAWTEYAAKEWWKKKISADQWGELLAVIQTTRNMELCDRFASAEFQEFLASVYGCSVDQPPVE